MLPHVLRVFIKIKFRRIFPSFILQYRILFFNFYLLSNLQYFLSNLQFGVKTGFFLADRNENRVEIRKIIRCNIDLRKKCYSYIYIQKGTVPLRFKCTIWRGSNHLWLPLTRELSSETRLRERKTTLFVGFSPFSPSVTATPCHLPRQREARFVQITLVRQPLKLYYHIKFHLFKL